MDLQSLTVWLKRLTAWRLEPGWARVGVRCGVLMPAALVGLLCLAVHGASRTEVVEIRNSGPVPLVEHTVLITLTAEQVQLGGFPPDFGSVRFYQGLDAATPIPFWMMDEQPGVSATFWVRVPRLPLGSGFITYSCEPPGGPRYEPSTLTARLLASEGIRLALRTDPPGKTTTHPTVVPAEGWMCRLSPETPPTVNRVLVDTMFPQNPSPALSANELENPEVWLSADRGLTWDWPPDVATNPAWKYHNNWIVGPPSGPDGGNNSDPEAVFLRAGSLPSGGPATDTLRVYHRTNSVGHAVFFDDLTSTDGAWTGVQISAFNPTSLVGPYNSFTSPTVIQEPDGSLRMWAMNLLGTNTVVMVAYSSQDGVTWTTLGTADMGLPKGLWGPWHFDVIREGGVYWLMGSFGAFRENKTSKHDVYMLRSEDGLHFSLLLPTVLEPASGWFGIGAYRPSMLYVPGEGLEIYVGCNARESSTPGVGGTGRWFDAGWNPHLPRSAPAISTVFWGSARDFVSNAAQWPHPWFTIDDSQNATTLLSVANLLAFASQSPVIPRARVDSNFLRPRDHEYHMRLKVDPDSYVALQASGSYGPWIDSYHSGLPPQSGVQFRWGSRYVPVAGPVPLGDINAFHSVRFRRVGNVGRFWWDGGELPPGPFEVLGSDNADDLTWQIARTDAPSVTMGVDWYFYRDAVEAEPTVNIGCDDHDACTADGYDPQNGCIHIAKDCDDHDVCTDDSCDPQVGECVNAPKSCDDGDLCTIDRCDPQSACLHQAVYCDDGNPGTEDHCDPQTGGCVHAATPKLTSAVSVKTHGGAGDFGIDVTAGDAIEPRAGGPSLLIVSFDRPVQTVNGLDVASVGLSSGRVDALVVAETTATILLSGVNDGETLKVVFPGIVNSEEGSPVSATLCFTVMSGDVNADRRVNTLDMGKVRSTLGEPVNAANFRSDLSADGRINVLDLTRVRLNVGQIAPDSCP
ncbi:MAG: hypothetical protein KA354_12630 [Phycisphaerae bacterium]|nr:hypothetical protein [Phycisphaerae bacterium]